MLLARNLDHIREYERERERERKSQAVQRLLLKWQRVRPR